MNSQSEQNGRPQAAQSGASRDPRLRNVSSSEPPVEVCRDYVWGICTKHGNCRFRHECTIEEMKSILIFCHDYQNRVSCTLPNCTYLHTSKKEENLFLTTGQLPRVLLERHAAMNAAAAAAASNSAMQSMEGLPPPVYIAQPPPPPPPLVTAPPPLPLSTAMPPPLPPPPPPPPTEASTVVSVASAIYTAAPQTTPAMPLSQPPPPLPMFDASKPPPNMLNGSVKRPFNDNCQAGPSKLRKTDDLQVPDSMCEKCLQRELSSDLCLEEVEKLNRQKEYKMFLYRSKSEETENMRAMVRLLLPSEIRLAVEEYIDGVQSPPLGLSVPMQLMMHRLLEDRYTNSSNVMDSIQLSSMRELLIGYLLNSTANDRIPSPESPNSILSADLARSTSSSIQTNTNGLSRLLNGQSPNKSPQDPPVALHSRVPRTYGSASSVDSGAAASSSAAYPSYQPGVPPPAPAAACPAYQPAVPPPAYPPYQPAVPPPAHAPFAPPYQATVSRTGAALPGASRGPAARPPVPAPPPPHPAQTEHTYGQYFPLGYP